MEAAVVEGLKEHLMCPEYVRDFVAEFHAELNRLSASQDSEREQNARLLEKTERDIRKLIEAIKDGVPGSAVKDEMGDLERQRLELQSAIDAAPAPQLRLHPNLAHVYREKVENLAEALNDGATRAEASEAIRGLIEEVRLVPENGRLHIELHGELAALLALGQEKHRRRGASAVQLTLVAGAGFEPATFRL